MSAVLRLWFSSKFPKMSQNGPISRKSLLKSRNKNILEKFKLNRNLRRIPFKMMWNMSMLRNRFSNERWRGAPLSSLKAYFLSWQKLLATIFFKRNQSSDNRSHGFGAKFLLKKLSASDFSYERKSAFILFTDPLDIKN